MNGSYLYKDILAKVQNILGNGVIFFISISEEKNLLKLQKKTKEINEKLRKRGLNCKISDLVHY